MLGVCFLLYDLSVSFGIFNTLVLLRFGIRLGITLLISVCTLTYSKVAKVLILVT